MRLGNPLAKLFGKKPAPATPLPTDLTWARLARQWLARQDNTLYQQALAAAPDALVRQVLQVAEGDFEPDKSFGEALHQRLSVLMQSGQQEVASTLVILAMHSMSALAEHFIYYPLTEQNTVFQQGLEACEQLKQLCQSLDDADLYAFYCSSQANGLYRALALGQAVDTYTEAEKLYRSLAQELPDVYNPNVAATLNNLGNALRDLKQLDKAVDAYTEALTIRRSLAKERPDVYNPDVAMTLNNLGNALRDLKQLDKAVDAYTEAEKLYRSLAQELPDVYNPNVAMTLNNLGNALGDLEEFKQAEQMYKETLTIATEPLMVARTHMFLGRLGAEKTSAPKADIRRSFETALTYSEQGINQIPEVAHRDLFKSDMEFAYDWLIEDYAHRIKHDGEAALIDRFLHLLESVRQVETLAGFATAAPDSDAHAIQSQLRTALSGTGGVRVYLQAQKAAFLWVHATDNAVVFALLTETGELQIELAGRDVLEKLFDLSERMADAIQSWVNASQKGVTLEQLIKAVTATALHGIPDAGHAAFSALPPSIQHLFTDGPTTIYTALCPRTVNLPWELLKPTPGTDSAYLGLTRHLPRTHSLVQLDATKERTPQGEGAVIVGNPIHNGANPLPSSLEAATNFVETYDCFHTSQFLCFDATNAKLTEALGDPDFALWLHLGHGSGDTRGLYLALSGDDRLYPDTIARLSWPQNPLVHQACCYTGHSLYDGGGRFDSHPNAALLAGASCVLAATQPLFDKPDADFCEKLYDRLISQKLPVGQALLETRREMAAAYGGSPLVWAQYALWGNPNATLIAP